MLICFQLEAILLWGFHDGAVSLSEIDQTGMDVSSVIYKNLAHSGWEHRQRFSQLRTVNAPDGVEPNH